MDNEWKLVLKGILTEAGQYTLREHFENLCNQDTDDKARLLAASLGGIDVKELVQEFVRGRSNDDNDQGNLSQWSYYPPSHIDKDICSTVVPEEWTRRVNAPAVIVNKNEDLNAEVQSVLTQRGMKIIEEKKLACVVMAGGDGTRLGHHGPKGTLILSEVPTRPSLFSIIMSRLKSIGRGQIPIFIMTSENNYDATIDHFESHNYFEVEKSNVFFFKQQQIPSFGLDGQLLLKNECSLTSHPEGNGGIFGSLEKSGMLQVMEEKEIKWLHIFGVDNVLVKPGDPLFVGICDTVGVSVGNKCCLKSVPEEKVGVQAWKRNNDKENGIPCVLEYSEIPPDLVAARDKDGRLKFSSANIVNHLMTLTFVKSVVNDMNFRYHQSIKKVPYYDIARGTTITDKLLDKPNGIKLERFIFDAFELAQKVLVLEVDRKEEFSPIKNAVGVDSPESATRDLLSLHNH